MTLVHKKGDKNNPLNYRGLAMLNTTLKLLTKIISWRIETWAESFHILPEAQAGFRKRRSCLDNLFTLNAVIQTRIIEKRETYAIFVDFKQAFDSINHTKLWNKLFQLGVSGKILRLLANIYRGSSTVLYIDGKSSEDINITQGVLQGDSLSPIHFCLFIADMEQYFKDQGTEGVYINQTADIMMLLYADDLVILCNSPTDIQRKLRCLEKYCYNNDLKINQQKTKILKFYRGRARTTRHNFTCQNEKIEVTKEYTYLGLPFTSSGLYRTAKNTMIGKARCASGSIKNLMARTKLTAWDSRIKLYNSVVLPTLLFGAEIYSLQYTNELEKVQTGFFKNIYNWSRTTPNYIVRAETDQPKLEVTIFKLILGYCKKLLLMNPNRYPKLCYDKLIELDRNSRNIPKYNWVTQVKEKFNKIQSLNSWNEQKYTTLETTQTN